jgi:hypothetical protein
MPEERSFTLSETDLDQLANAIATHAPAARGGATETFCQVWPQAKEGLTLLRDILQFVPGVGMFAAPAIGIVTAAGDAAQKGLCQ